MVTNFHSDNIFEEKLQVLDNSKRMKYCNKFSVGGTPDSFRKQTMVNNYRIKIH